MKLNKSHLLFAGALVILTILLLKFNKCNNSPTTNVTTTDTIVAVQIIHDTIIKTNTVNIYKPVTKFVYLVDSSNRKNCDSTRVYTSSLKDSIINISVIDSVNGKLLGAKISYVAKVPKDCVIVTKIITKYEQISVPYKYQLLSGIEVGGNLTSFNNISPTLLFQYNNKIYSYKYNILLNTHNIGICIKLFGK